MTTRQRNRAMTSMVASSLGVAATAAALGFGVLSTAGQALAEPVIPTPTPGAPVPPGTPVVEQNVAGGDAPPAPPPVGAPMVPEVAAQDAHYGSGNGPLGSLRDAWHQAKDPFNTAEEPDGQVPGGSAPPPGAGPAPALPPGYVSINAPGSETAAAPKDPTQGPALPPGYYPLNGPPPPADYGGPAAAAAAAPANPNAPKPYVPVVSPPPPPLILPPQ
jgi:hypothetical protein